jgi:hypothetical protein
LLPFLAKPLFSCPYESNLKALLHNGELVHFKEQKKKYLALKKIIIIKKTWRDSRQSVRD